MKKNHLLLIVLITCLVFTSVPLFGGASYAASKPGKVKISSAKAVKNTIVVKYKKIKKAKKYQISYKKASDKKWTKKTSKKQSYTLQGLLYGTKYKVKVRAYNGKWGKWSKVKSVTTPSSIMITKLTSTTKKPRSAETLTSNYGKKYKYAITNDAGYNGSAGPLTYKYLLDSQFKNITGTIYIPAGAKSSKTSALTILGDGVVLYTSPAMNKISRAVSLNVDIRGVNELTVEWTNNSEYSNISDLECCLANCYLYYANPGLGSIDKSVLPTRLTDLTSLYSKPGTSVRMTDNMGNTYHSAIYNRVDNLHGNKTPVYEYLLDSKYKRFTGTLYIPEGLSFTGAVSMSVTADGKTIYKSPDMTRTSGPVNFDINISGCNDLQVTFSDKSWHDSASDKTLCIAYAYIYRK